MKEDLNRLSVEALGKLFPIIIEEYNPEWKNLFLSEKQIGYQFIPKPENPPPHMMFAKGYSETGYTGQSYHLHIRYRGEWDELIFRDYLIRNPESAWEYGELKRRLSIVFINDREAYTNNKTDFIKEII